MVWRKARLPFLREHMMSDKVKKHSLFTQLDVITDYNPNESFSIIIKGRIEVVRRPYFLSQREHFISSRYGRTGRVSVGCLLKDKTMQDRLLDTGRTVNPLIFAAYIDLAFTSLYHDIKEHFAPKNKYIIIFIDYLRFDDHTPLALLATALPEWVAFVLDRDLDSWDSEKREYVKNVFPLHRPRLSPRE